jgi:hypothetical protein
MPASLVNNPDVRAAIANRPSIDRYTTTIHGPMEWLVSVSYRINEHAIMIIALSIDMVSEDHQTVLSIPIGTYQWTTLTAAVEDARYVASRYGLSLRIQDMNAGWKDDSIAIIHPLHPDNWRGPSR